MIPVGEDEEQLFIEGKYTFTTSVAPVILMK
jgi:hypothetical protein